MCEIADARAASKKTLAPRVIRPEDCGYEIRGGGNATRQIVDVMPPPFPANLRWDIFNVFNTVNFGLPNKDIGTPSTFGTISGLASDPRTMQLALRLTF